MHVRHVGVIAVLVVAAAACGSSSSKSGTSSGAGASGSNSTSASTAAPSSSGGAYGGAYGATPSTAAAATAATPVKVAKVGTGMLVVDTRGRTVYALSTDTATSSTCTTGCAQAWPPVTATGAPPATINGLKITTLTRSDGSKQVVVNGHPAYTFSGDLKAGDKNGEGIGGKWYYLNAQGQPDKG